MSHHVRGGRALARSSDGTRCCQNNEHFRPGAPELAGNKQWAKICKLNKRIFCEKYYILIALTIYISLQHIFENVYKLIEVYTSALDCNTWPVEPVTHSVLEYRNALKRLPRRRSLIVVAFKIIPLCMPKSNETSTKAAVECTYCDISASQRTTENVKNTEY